MDGHTCIPLSAQAITALLLHPLQCLVVAAKDEKEKKEGLVLVNTRLLALVTNHDSIEANPEKLEAAAAVSWVGRGKGAQWGGEKLESVAAVSGE